jgi:alpha/beta superfamily hydrolase
MPPRAESITNIIIDAIAVPAASGMVREALCLVELTRLLLRFPFLLNQPRGKREPVLIFPPYGTGDGSTTLLKAYLRLLGYRARGWGLGRNQGKITELLPRALRRLASFAKRSDQKVALIGWSFGGYLARELGRERPELISRIITLGTPVIGGPKYTALCEKYRKRGMDIEAIATEIEFRNQAAPIETPVVAIYSRTDAIVAWQACIDQQTATVKHVEVHTTHYGFGFSPEVYRIIAQSLAQPNDHSPHESGGNLRRRRHARIPARR